MRPLLNLKLLQYDCKGGLIMKIKERINEYLRKEGYMREDNFPKLKIVQGRTIIPRDRLLEWLDEQTRYDELPR